jgi:hypothetical protein
MSAERRQQQVVKPAHPWLSLVWPSPMLPINRSGFHHRRAVETPWYGSGQMARHLRQGSHMVGRERIRRPMARIGLTRNTSSRAQRCHIEAIGSGGIFYGFCGEAAEPGMLHRHHLHPEAALLFVSGGGDGLGDAKVAGTLALGHGPCVRQVRFGALSPDARQHCRW